MNREQTDALNKLNEAYKLLCDGFSTSSFSDLFSDYDAFKLVLVIFLHDRLIAKTANEKIKQSYNDSPVPIQFATNSDQFLDVINQNLHKIHLQVPLADNPSLSYGAGFDDSNTTDDIALLSSALNLRAYQNVLSTRIKKDLYELFKSFNDKPESFYRDEEFAKGVLDKYAESKKIMLAKHEITYIPWNIDELMVALVTMDVTYEKYLYSLGLSNILLALAFSQRSFDIIHNLPFLTMGHEEKEDLWALALLRFAVYGNNAYSELKPFLSTGLDLASFSMGADVVFYTPFWGKLELTDITTYFPHEDEAEKIKQYEPELLNILSYLREQMVALMPLTLLAETDINADAIRRKLVDDDMLEAVITLPSTSPASSLSTQMVLLLINNHKYRKPSHVNKVLFITATPDGNNQETISSKEIQSIVYKYNNFKRSLNDEIASRDDIQQNVYDLSPQNYIGNFYKEIDYIKSHNGQLLKDICEIKVGAVIQSHSKNIPVININNLSDNIKSPHVDLSKLGLESTAPQDSFESNINSLDIDLAKINIQIVKEKCILVSLIGTTLKPTIYNPNESDIKIYGLESGIALGKNVAATIPDASNVDFDYFYYQLHSDFVQRQHEAIYSSSAIGLPSTTVEGLENIVIPIPKSLDDQRNITTDIKLSLIKESNLIDARSSERLKISIDKQATALRPDDVKRAIQSGETNRQEFKETLRYDIHQSKFDDKILPRQAIKAVASFMNANGGSLYIGVSNDKTISGIERDVYDDDTYKRYLTDKITKLLGMKAATSANIHIIKIDGKRLCVVYCPRCNDQIFMKSEKDPDKTEFWVRMSASNKELTGKEMMDYINARKP